MSNFLQYSVSALVAPCVLLEKVLTKEKKMSRKKWCEVKDPVGFQRISLHVDWTLFVSHYCFMSEYSHKKKRPV